MSDARVRELVGERTTHLTLAVRLEDAFTGNQPVGDPQLTARDVETDPVVNPSGYHLFLDLPDEPLTLLVDGGDRYLDVERTVDPTDHDPPAIDLELMPSTAYRFPAGATLLRGVVREDGTGDPIPDATVSLLGTDRETVTDAAGRFVLFITGITADDIGLTDDDEEVVQIDGDDPVLEATHPEHEAATASKPVVEGSTVKYEIIL